MSFDVQAIMGDFNATVSCFVGITDHKLKVDFDIRNCGPLGFQNAKRLKKNKLRGS